MGRDLLAKAVRDVRGAAIGWALGLSAYAALVTAAFPSIRGNEAVSDYVDTLPEAMLAFFGSSELTSAAGFYQAELFSYLPALLAVFTVGKAIQLTVGEERDGTMDLVLAQPVARWRVFVARFAGLASATFLVAAGLAVALALGGALVGLTVGEIAGLAAWCFVAALPALVFGAATVGVAGFAHRETAPLVAGASLAAGGFLIDGLARIIEWLDPIYRANPYHWYGLNNPVAGDVSWLGLAGLVALIGLFVALGALGFERKDVGT